MGSIVTVPRFTVTAAEVTSIVSKIVSSARRMIIFPVPFWMSSLKFTRRFDATGRPPLPSLGARNRMEGAVVSTPVVSFTVSFKAGSPGSKVFPLPEKVMASGAFTAAMMMLKSSPVLMRAARVALADSVKFRVNVLNVGSVTVGV